MPAALPAAGSAGASARGLPWAEGGFLVAAAVAVTVVVDPLGWRLAADPYAKHLALALSLPALAAAMLGARRAGAPRGWAPLVRVTAALWPLLALAFFVIAGSLHARLGAGIQNTFLNVGLYMLMAGAAALLTLVSADPGRLARAYCGLIAIAAVIMSAGLIANYGVRQVYHEQIFLVIPIAVLCFMRVRAAFVRWAGVLFFLAMAAFSHKYTAYFTAALTVAYLACAVAYPRLASRPPVERAAVVYWSCLAALAAVAVLVHLGTRGSLDLPTGNPEFRVHTYLGAWERFQASPLAGTLFATEAVEKFTPFRTGIADNILPSHSDVLDLLANGGVLAIVLWAYGLARIARIARANLLRPRHLAHPWAPEAHTLAVMSAAGVIAYCFNPILLQPSMAYLLWTHLGLLLGLSLRAAAPDGR
jgi:hypothetical protein